MTPREKFTQMRADLAGALIERETEIDLCLTALVAREHVLFVGPPGTAKSMLSNAIVQWLDGNGFRILLTKFTDPAETCGPMDLMKLKAGTYERVTEGMLPEADIAFFDEIWKASSAILNTLLTIMEERTFKQGRHVLPCPLKMVVAASNEWPGSNGDGKETGALFDRFALRRHVSPIASARGLDRLLWGDTTLHISTTLDPVELEDAQAEASALPWTDRAKEAFHAILREAKSEGIVPGDRRMRKAVGVARAYAWLNGHAAVENDDLEILSAVLWDDPTEQPQKLAKIVGRTANPVGLKINSLLLEINQIAEEAQAARELPTNKRAEVYVKASIQLREIHDQKLAGLTGLKADAARAEAQEVAKVIRLATVESF
jgi:MoxR-like ATPase